MNTTTNTRGVAMVTHQDAAEALDSLDDYARMGTGVDAHGPRGMLERYIAQQAATLKAAQGGVTEAMVEDAMRVFRQAYAVARMGSPRRVGATYAAVRAVLEHQQGHGAEQAAVDREVGRRWRENSSLEAWFPVTATTMKRQAEEIAATTKLLAPLFKNVDPMPGDGMIGINRTVTLYGYAADVVKQLKAVTAPPAQPVERVPSNIRELPAKWRGPWHGWSERDHGRRDGYKECANHLEREIAKATASPAPSEGGKGVEAVSHYVPPKPCTCLTLKQREYCADRHVCSSVVTQSSTGAAR